MTTLSRPFPIGTTGLNDRITNVRVARGSVCPPLNRLETAGLVRHKEPYRAAPEDDGIAAATAAFIGVETVASTDGDDWYARNDGWAEEVPDLSDEES